FGHARDTYSANGPLSNRPGGSYRLDSRYERWIRREPFEATKSERHPDGVASPRPTRSAARKRAASWRDKICERQAKKRGRRPPGGKIPPRFFSPPRAV